MVVDLKGADEGLVRTFQNFDDLSVQFLRVAPFGKQADAHTVAGQCMERVVVIDAHADAVGQIDKVASALCAGEDAFAGLCMSVETDFALVVLHEVVGHEHFVQYIDAQHLERMCGEFEQLKQVAQRVILSGMVAEKLDDDFAHVLLRQAPTRTFGRVFVCFLLVFLRFGHGEKIYVFCHKVTIK